MSDSLHNSATKPPFIVAWFIVALFSLLQLGYILLCHTMADELQSVISLEQRVFIRTIFYILAIIIFPVVRLIRYVQIRLNQTMPGYKSASQRYLLTVIVSQSLIESIGLFGLIMFILGDDFNTLYIFSGLAILGFFIYRPKATEYVAIVDALHISDEISIAKK